MFQMKIQPFLKLIILFLSAGIFLVSCNTIGDEQTVQPLEYRNLNTQKKVLILAKGSEFKAKVIEATVQRLRWGYSITLDDLDNIEEYNFMLYSVVVLMESCRDNQFKRIRNYLSGYSGVNNIVVFGTHAERPMDSPEASLSELNGVAAVTCASRLVSANEAAASLVKSIRAKGKE